MPLYGALLLGGLGASQPKYSRATCELSGVPLIFGESQLRLLFA
jgi:hypothetical protein